MANEEVLGPRKTMFVLVIVVGCFAVLWPRILSPLILGHSRDHLKPNQYDRDAGCCEVIFDTELAVLEVLNEVCSSAIGTDGKLSPYAAIECRKSVNETCGLDIAAFLKRTDNVGKTTKMLVETMKNSNGSCLKDNFGVPIWTLSTHAALNSWTLQETLKQERPPMRGVGPHPALRERGRAIPAETPTPPSRGPVPLPPHVRVRSSPLSVYFELDIKPPPIPGMRPPLGSPGGPVAAPKSSMGFVMPIYTICIIVFFVYTLSKILFKRTGSVPYDHITPDPQFRRRVFRDESRSSPEAKLVVTAISGLVAEVQQQMEASYAQSQQRQDVQDNHTRPCTNGTVLGNSTVHIVTSDYREQSKEKSPDIQNEKEPSSEPKLEAKENIPEPKESSPEPVKEQEQPTETKESIFERRKHEIEPTLESRHENEKEPSLESKEISPEPKERRNIDDLIALTENIEAGKEKDSLTKDTDDFLTRVRKEQNELQIVTTSDLDGTKQGKPSTPELLEEALKEDKDEVSEEEEAENGSVKHEAEMVKSIFLETEIPQQSRVLVADFGEDRPGAPAPKHSPLVVSGKMTLSLIQDTPRDTPERELESTLDDFTTASAVTQSAAEKGHLSEEEVEEEIEVEEIEEEIEVEEEEYEDDKELRKIEPVKEEKSNEELVKQDEIKDLDERNTEETNVELENEDEEDLSNVKESKKGELKEEDLEEEELIQINNELSKKDEVKDLDESKNTEELDVQEFENEDELADEVTFEVKQLLKEAKTVIEDSNEEETKKDEPKYDERKEDEPKNEDEQRLDESKNKEEPRLDEPKNEDESRLHEPKNEDEPKLDEPKNEDEPKIEDEPRLDEPKFEDEPNNKDEPKLEELKNEDGPNNKDESKLDEPKNQDELRLDEPKIEDESKLEEAKNENKQESEEAKPVLKNVKKHKKKRGRRTHEQNDSDE